MFTKNDIMKVISFHFDLEIQLHHPLKQPTISVPNPTCLKKIIRKEKFRQLIDFWVRKYAFQYKVDGINQTKDLLNAFDMRKLPATKKNARQSN